jgi:ATP-dependent helicase HrpA
MERSDASPITSMGDFIAEHLGVQIPASAWPVDDLPDHLKMRIAVVGPRGEELRAGREPDVLYKAAPQSTNTDAYADARKQWERNGLTDWDFGELPDSVTLKGGNGRKWTVYPGLKPAGNGDGADLRLFEDFARANRTHPDGVAALYRRRFSEEIKFLKKSLSLPGDLKSSAQYFGGPKAVEMALLDSVVDALFRKNIRTEAVFREHGASVKERVLPAGRDRLQAVSNVLKAYTEARTILYELEVQNRNNERMTAFLSGLRTSLARLVPENFLSLYDTDRLGHIDRYISALAIRARRALVSFDKDQTKAKEIKVHVDHLNRMLETLSPSTSDDKRKALEDYHWLIEEYRVSLFAQELKTPVKVSPKRLETKRAEIERMA